MMKKKGKLFIISAPSGCGKTTLVNMLIRNVKGLKRSVSMTTRGSRRGEEDKKDYIFISEKEFKNRIKKDFYLEWAKVFGRYYGTPKNFVNNCIKKGENVILSIDVQGAKNIKKRSADAVAIFLMPPSLKALEDRLRFRNTDAKKEIGKRLKIAKKEMAQAKCYDYIVINDNIKDALNKLKSIINAERCKVEV